MEKMWAPWRVELFKQTTEGCFFCNYTKQNNDKENLILERGKNCFVIMNRYPYSNGHLMVVPYKHTSCLNDLDKETRSDFMEYVMKWQELLKKRFMLKASILV